MWRDAVVQARLVKKVTDRGFGFMKTDEGEEVFIHHSVLPRGMFDTLPEGTVMQVEIENDSKGRGRRVRRTPRVLSTPE